MYSKPKQGSSLIPFLKIFKVDFENYEPYIPMSGGTDEEEKEEEEKKEEETEEEDEESSNEEEEKPFDWQLGEILEEYYYGNFTSIDYEFDYEGISSSLNIKPPMLVDGIRFYKGVQGQFFAGWFEEKSQEITMEDIPLINRLFIEDLTFTEDGTQLSCKGADVLLEEKYEFDFHQMKRSKILEEMIKTAGLEPEVDPTGLIDDVIDYTNVKKSDTSSGGDASGAPNISSMVKQAIKGKKGARAKAEAIYQAMVDHLTYSGYSCSNFPHTNEGADQAWQRGAVNCADSSSIGRVAYTAGGLKAQVVHGPNHFWVEVNIDGNIVASDVTGAEGAHCVRSLGQVYSGLSKDSDNGDWPSC